MNPALEMSQGLVGEKSAEEQVLIARPIGQYGGIEYLAAGSTLPSFKGTDEIVEFLAVHSAFALRTFHEFPPD